MSFKCQQALGQACIPNINLTQRQIIDKKAYGEPRYYAECKHERYLEANSATHAATAASG